MLSSQYTNTNIKVKNVEKKMSKSEHDKNSADTIEHKRTILGLYDKPLNKKETLKYAFGLILYVIIFVMAIPYLMLHNNIPEEIFLAYIPNVDMLATVLGYEGGPFSNIWRYLYNPSNLTLFGFFSTTLMNYFALLGGTFMVAWQTHKHKSWKRGWSAAFIFLLMTYLIPGNVIVILQNRVANYLNEHWSIGSNEAMLRYILVVLFGLILSVSIIFTESLVIKSTRHHIEYGIHLAHNAVKYHFNF